MKPDPATHTLLRIGGPQALQGESPTWGIESLQRAPWVVVRRARSCGELIPVGVRGELREQRYASWLAPRDILEIVTPRTLAHRRAWLQIEAVRRASVPALNALDQVETVMRAHGLEGMWGPGGSVGFELASARATAAINSDLDLIVECTTVDACALWAALAALPVRVDALLETPHGAVALQEYARSRSENGSFLLRTTQGPRLTQTLGAWRFSKIEV